MDKSGDKITFYYDDKRIIVTSVTRPTQQSFRRPAKVQPGTYACALVDRVFQFICGCAIDVRAEYSEYYAVEYRSLLHCLYHKYGLPGALVEKLQPAVELGHFLGLTTLSWGRDWQMQGMLEDCETGLPMLLDAVAVRWAQTELESDHED